MGRKVLDPTVEVGPIEYRIDHNASVDVEPELKFYGAYVPLLKLGDRTITWAKILDFRLSVRLFKLPTVQITIDDSDFVIREHLKDDLQIGIIRVGYKNYFIKFNTLFKRVSSVANDGEIILSGIIYNEKMFDDYPQTSYKNKSVSEILEDLCKNTGQGLFIFDNDDLSRKYDHLVQSNMNYFEYVIYILNNYTSNLWTFDANYFLHVGDYNSIVKDKLATYSLDTKTGEVLPTPLDMKFYQNFLGGRDPNNDNKSLQDQSTSANRLVVADYTTNTTYSEDYINLRSDYRFFDDKGETDLFQNDFGIGSESSNTFSGFINIRRPFQQRISAKWVSKQVLSVYTDYVLPELNPFDRINLEFYKYPRPGTETDPKLGDLDVEHSGDKSVLGYDITYSKREEHNQGENGYTGMTIFCI